MPLSQPKTASMVFMDAILRQYAHHFTWFSLKEPLEGLHNPYNIPYDHFGHLKRPGRFPFLRLLLNYVLWSRVQARKAAQFGRQHHAQVVLADLAFEAVIVGRLAAKYLGLPLLVNIHDDPVNRLRVKGYPAWFVNWYRRQFAKTLTAAKRVGVISDYMGEVYQQRYGVQTTTLFIGVEPEKCLPPRPLDPAKQPILIGSLGSMNSAENWGLLIEAVRLLNQRHGGGKFRILHIGELPPHLPRPDLVEVTGWVPEEAFLQHLSRIDAGFVNWPFAPEHYETSQTSFPLKIHSFIQAQKPLIALGPEKSSVVRFVNDYGCGVLCTAAEAALLANQIDRLCSPTGCYGQALQGMLQLKQAFSSEHFLSQLESFISV